MDWREFRANEFMGALLVPRELLHRALVRGSIGLGLTLRDRGGSEPVLDRFFDLARFDGLLIELGERFGVSAEFIECRLKRYGLVH
ncbi:MAG: ImmA/IrrE family metallo-endopeptidase [Reyranella sp.]|uniref:ImmA/IrrE family metallo-endopeptidase n=1 Tax=Reyranella sp. TaxID=1929291 RepID=UPI003D0D2F1B